MAQQIMIIGNHHLAGTHQETPAGRLALPAVCAVEDAPETHRKR
jgi:hypothetical protein